MANRHDSEMSLIGHLTELRARLIISILALVVCTLAAGAFSKPALQLLTAPFSGLQREPDREATLTFLISADRSVTVEGGEALTDLESLSTKNLRFRFEPDPASGRADPFELPVGLGRTQGPVYLSPLDPFMIRLKVALILGIFLASPIILWQAWIFVQPGLRTKEKRVVWPMLAGALALFPVGATFAYFIMRLVLIVMQSYQLENINPMYDINKYLSLMITMMLVFGVIFEMPLVIALAARVGLVSVQTLRKYRRHAYVAMAVAAMLLTPADPFSMIAAYIPMIGLYELSIALCGPLAGARQSDEEPEEGGDKAN